MIAAHKLTRKSLRTLLTVLELDDDSAVLTPVESRPLRHLLDYLTVRSEIAGRAGTSTADWKFWLDAEFLRELLAHLGIVRSQDVYRINGSESGQKQNKRKKSKKKTNAESAFFAQKDLRSADAPIAGLNGCPRRQPISAELYRTIVVRQGSYCFWCGAAVAYVSEIPLHNRTAKTSGSITFLNADGGLSEKAIAPGNLVISCLACNHERERTTAARKVAFVRTRIACKGCDGSFFHPGCNCCSLCGNADFSNAIKSVLLFRKIILFINNLANNAVKVVKEKFIKEENGSFSPK